MADQDSEQTHILLKSARHGDEAATARLIEMLYPRLHEAANGMLRDEQYVSLCSGDLVHDVALRLIKIDTIEWENKAHFMALASRLMRRALIDHIRAKRARKRDHIRVTLATHLEGPKQIDIYALHQAMIRLSAINPQGSEIVEMRYFGSMSIEDVACVTGLSEPTVKRRWQAARIWLIDAMNQHEAMAQPV